VEKVPKKKSKAELLPEYARRINALRGDRSQGEFARSLGVSAMAVSHWETGKNAPGSKLYLKLAKMAAGQERKWFLARASSETVDLAVEAFAPSPFIVDDVALTTSGGSEFAHIPLVSGGAGAGTARFHQDDVVEGFISLPREMCANGASMKCIRVDGDSMEPTIRDGTIVAVDRTERRPQRLRDQIVAVRHDAEGVKVKRLVWFDEKYVLASDKRGYPTFDLEPDWEIAGRVVWWIQRP
jgi:phage repressor protein C with HTH and peptisase S24 domain